MALTKEQILNANPKPAIERVNVPEWGCDVWVRALTGQESDAYEAEINKRVTDESGNVSYQPDLSIARTALLSRVLCDEDGKSLGFTQAEIGDLSNKALGRLFKAAMKLNDLSDLAVEDEAGNSESAT